MRWRATACAVLLGVIFTATGSVAQNASTLATRKYPNIGLVLEGGSALGLAHIGVIQWLEEHHIPVSYVAGTSMGGLIGGVYATGMSAGEVREVVQTIDWDEVLSGQTPFEDLSFRRKQDAHEYPSSLEFGLRKGLMFPAGFNSGQQVSLILDRIALPYSNLQSFDNLPTPFACVAIDLQSGKEHVFRSGSLAFALRSTMSLPGIFTPVRSGDHIYADGGLLNNLPVDVAKEMGADVVLAVHLEAAPLDPEKPLSSFAVLSRSISVVIAANELRSMEQADLMVSVPLQNYSSSDYNRSDAIIKAGYDAAAAKAAVLTRFSVDEDTWNQYLTERNARRKPAPIPRFVEVEDTNPQMARGIEHDMSNVVGKPIDTAKLTQDIIALSGTGRFLSITYAMVERDEQPGLRIQTTPKPYAPPTVRPLILIDGSDYNVVLFSIGARITFLDLGGFRSELRNDVILGSQYGIESEYYRPFSPVSHLFVAPRAGFYSSEYNIYSRNDLVAGYRRRQAGGGLDVGYEVGRIGELRLGYEGGEERLSRQIGVPILPTVSGATGNARLQFLLNTLDQPAIPRAGQSLQLYAKWFNANPGSPQGFPLSEIQSQNYFRLNEASSVYLNGYGGTSFGYTVGVPAFSLGGTQRLVAYGTNELLTNQYVLGQLGYIRQLSKLPPLLGNTVDLLAMYELGQTYQLPNGPKPPGLPGDFAGALVVNTIFGPVEVGGAIGNHDHQKFFFRIGRIF